MAVAWAAGDIYQMPGAGAHRGGEDIEALIAISRFIRGYAVDLSGTLEWPWASHRVYDYPPMEPRTPAQCMDERAAQIAAEHDRVVVLCAGDIDSTAVAAALIKHGVEIEVRYTRQCVRRYPRLFNEIFPAHGATMNDRTGYPLAGNGGAFVDGRTGDDFLANYQGKALAPWMPVIRRASLADTVARVAGARAAEAGLWRFVEARGIETPWALAVNLFRCCMSQYDALIAGLIEPIPHLALGMRVPFYDHPLFTAAAQWMAEAGPPSIEQESWPLRQYTFQVFGDAQWRESVRPMAGYYLYDARWFSYWLDDRLQPRPYREFPWRGGL